MLTSPRLEPLTFLSKRLHHSAIGTIAFLGSFYTLYSNPRIIKKYNENNRNIRNYSIVP